MIDNIFLGYLLRTLARLFPPAPGRARLAFGQAHLAFGQAGTPHLASGPALGAFGEGRPKAEWNGRGRLFNFSGVNDANSPESSGTGDAGSAGSGPPPETALPAIGDLYRKYSPTLYWVCMRYTRSREDAEDMVQQVFVKAQKNLDRFRGQSGVYTWLYRIAVNECLELIRRRKFTAEGDPEELQHLLPVFPEMEMDAKMDLQRIMAETDPQTVEILFLLYMEGLTQEEVVETLGISRSMVYRKITAFKAGIGRFQ
jgi:RNA polymerase sigma factor (sigma-70 family)